MKTGAKKTRANIMLFMAAFIWGSAFVAQSAGMDHISPIEYTMARSFLGFLVLIPVVLISVSLKNRKLGKEDKISFLPDRTTLVGGICCGCVLGIASTVQQIGISMTTAGKAGFITALYIVFVPVFGIFLKKKTPKIIWLCVLISITGFFLLCMKGDFTIGAGDLVVFACSVSFTVHILVIDHFGEKDADPVKMSCIQFLVAGILCLAGTFIFETPTLQAIWDARLTIAYAGVLSNGVAFTFQTVAQKDAEPTTATLLMSLESVFAALSGWIILNEQMSLKELAGCLLVFTGVVLAQIPFPERKKKIRN